MERYRSFVTERLILRPTLPEDAGFILELFNSPKWLKYIGDREIKTVVDAEEYIRKVMLSQRMRLGYSCYTIVRKEDGCKLGTCGLYDRKGLKGIDIGFAFLPSYERMGYGYEAAAKLKTLALSEFGLRTLYAITRSDNVSSQSLLKKIGMIPEGRTLLPNDPEDWLVYRSVK